MTYEYSCIVKNKEAHLKDEEKNIDKRVRFKVIITEGLFDKNLRHRKILGMKLKPLATVVSKRIAKKLGLKLNESDKFKTDCYVFIREKFHKYMTEDEEEALIVHELAHFILGHETIKDENDYKRQEKEVRELIGKEFDITASLFNERMTLMFGIDVWA